jgi:hypothetical protein
VIAHCVFAAVITKLCELLRSPNRLVRTAASYGIEAVLKSGTDLPNHLQPAVRNHLQPTFQKPRTSNSHPSTADKWTPCTSSVKQEAPITASHRFSFSLETLNLTQIISDEEPLLRDSSEKHDSAQPGCDSADKVKKQLSSAIRDSVSGLSRNSIRFALRKSQRISQFLLLPSFILFAILVLTGQSFDLRCRDVDTEAALGEVLSEISNSSSAKPHPSTEAPSRKRKVAASLSKVLPTKCSFDSQNFSLTTPHFRVLPTLPNFLALASAYWHSETRKRPSDPQQQLLQRVPL